MNSNLQAVQFFSDSQKIARYAETTPQKVPGLADLHLMALLLLSENAPEAPHILVLGAGGGLELKAFAQARPRWSFTGVDPSQPMLDLARDILGSVGSQVQLLNGYIEGAPAGPFDGATCLLTLHFLSRPERLRTLRALHERLKPGAPLIVAHHTSAEDGKAERWMTRSLAFAAGAQADFAEAASFATVMAEALPLLSTGDEEALLVEAGFSDVELFYAGFSFRGWVAKA